MERWRRNTIVANDRNLVLLSTGHRHTHQPDSTGFHQLHHEFLTVRVDRYAISRAQFLRRAVVHRTAPNGSGSRIEDVLASGETPILSIATPLAPCSRRLTRRSASVASAMVRSDPIPITNATCVWPTIVAGPEVSSCVSTNRTGCFPDCANIKWFLSAFRDTNSTRPSG